MAPYRENQLRKIADPPTIKAIDTWHSLSTQVIGRPLEVVVDNRRNNPQFSSFDGELNVAIPAGYQGRVVLSVWLDSFPNYNPLMLTHEVGHWILHLQGFRGFIRQPRDGKVEGLFNDVASHLPLYAFQKSIGHDPQTEIDSRCDHNIRLCKNASGADTLLSALLLSDDLLNCSWKKRQELEWTIRKYQPDIMKQVDKIISIASDFNLSNPVANLAFRKGLLKKLNMPGKWVEKDDVKATKELILHIEWKAR
jgi:hypothetical protein